MWKSLSRLLSLGVNVKEDKYVGTTFNGLKVLRFNSWYVIPCNGYKTPKCDILCHCGEQFVALLSNIKKGNTKSCGCLRLNDPRKHYKTNSRTYHTWETMIQRCTNPKNSNYYRYGGAGVTVCDEWLTSTGGGFLNFLEDMGERPKGTSLNRIHGAKVYSKEGCEWADNTIQAFDKGINKRSKTGVAGVRRNKQDTNWRASIGFKGKTVNLGHFDKFEDAVDARQKSRTEVLRIHNF